MIRIGCIIPAAGESRRLGRNKLAEPLAGITVLERTLTAVPTENLEAVAVVVREDTVERIVEKYFEKKEAKSTGTCRKRVHVVKYAGGPVNETIKKGLECMPGLDGYLFINGDMPLLERKSVEKLIAVFKDNRNCIVRMSAAGIAQNPVIFPGTAYGALMNLGENCGGNSVINSGKYEIIKVEAGMPCELLDVDTEEKLAEAAEFFTAGSNPKGEEYVYGK